MIRAYVHEPYISSPDTVSVSLVREVDEPGFHERHILHLLPGEDGRIFSRAWEPFETGSLEPCAPTLSLGHEEARLIATALIGYFGGVDNERMLRRDYDAERKRVDKLTDAVIEVARGTAASRG
jgi:hypothetical protein